jgi:hypothetical protein
VSQEVGYDAYPDALKSTLLSSIQTISIRNGWQHGERVRLVFHTSKPLKNIEIEVVKRTVSENLADYVVEFAFLVVGRRSGWTAFQPGFQGITAKNGGSVRGKQVPVRGTTIFLDGQRVLLSLVGATELRQPSDGCPDPILLRLNGASTFQDMEYLAQQVLDFTHMSWKTFNLSHMPVTITYSEAIASLLGRLRRVKNWNSDALRSTELKNSLWFI